MAMALEPLSLLFAGTGGAANPGGLTHSIAVGGGAEADDGSTAIDLGADNVAVVVGGGQQWQRRGRCLV